MTLKPLYSTIKNPPIPVIIYKNEILITEVSSYRQAVLYMKPQVSCGITTLRNAIADSIFEENNPPFFYNGDKYQFVTNEKRRILHLEETKEGAKRQSKIKN